MKNVCKIPPGQMREVTDSLLLRVFSNEASSPLFVRGPFWWQPCLFTTKWLTGLSLWGGGRGGACVPSTRRSSWDPRYLMSGASRREVRREQTHSAGLSHIERVSVCTHCTLRNKRSVEAAERVYLGHSWTVWWLEAAFSGWVRTGFYWGFG